MPFLLIAILSALLPHATTASILPDTIRLARLHRQFVSTHDQNPIQSQRFAEQGYQLAVRTGAERWVIRFLLDRSLVLIELGEYPTAQRICGEAWRRARAIGDWALAANALNHMADIITFQGDTLAGNRLYEEAVAAAKKGGARAHPELIKLRYNLAMQQFNQPGGTARAIQILEEMLADGGQDSVIRPMMGQIMGNLVHMYRLTHQPARALAVGQKGLAWTRAARNPDDEAHVLTAMAWTLADEHRFAEARSLVRQSYALSRNPAVAAERRTDALEQLIRIEAALGHWQEAFEIQTEARAMLDSVRSTESVRTTAAQNARFATERKEFQIRELTQQQRIARAEATAQAARNRLLLMALVGLVVALVVFGALYWQLRRSRQRLASSEAELRRANRTKDQLMSIIGHDLRSPMAAFQQVGPLLNALADTPDSTELREIATEVTDRSRQVGTLLDNLLHWSRAQAGQITNRPALLDTALVIQSVEALFAPIALTKSVILRTEVVMPSPRVLADANLLATVLRNLVSNAIKYTPAGGSVVVAVASVGQELVFRVTDTGVGMSAERVRTLFDAAERISTTGTAGEKGTGLGLLVSDEFVRLLNSCLRVESRPGAGTTFAFTLPAA